jgi:hypothetical protein
VEKGRVDINRAETVPESLNQVFSDLWMALPTDEHFLVHRLLGLLSIMRDYGDDETMAYLFRKEQQSEERPILPDIISSLRAKAGKLLVYDEERYSIFHDRFRNFLTGCSVDETSPAGTSLHKQACYRKKEIRGFHRLFADSTMEYAIPDYPDNLRVYLLGHGYEHIYQVRDQQGLWQLLHNGEYFKTQIHEFNQFHASYNAVQRGIDLYAEQNGQAPDDDARLCRLALHAGKLASEARGDFRVAFHWAENRPMDDPDRIPDALSKLEILDEESFFKAALLLLWIETERQRKQPEEYKSDTEALRVVERIDRKIPEGQSSVNWNDFLSTDFMVWFAAYILSVFPEMPMKTIVERTSFIKPFLRSVTTLFHENTRAYLRMNSCD